MGHLANFFRPTRNNPVRITRHHFFRPHSRPSLKHINQISILLDLAFALGTFKRYVLITAINIWSLNMPLKISIFYILPEFLF